MPHLLLLLLHLKSTNVLLELALFDAMVVFCILEGHLGFLLELCELVKVLEDQMLYALLVDLDLDLVLLGEILQLALLVAEFGLFIF